MQLGTILVVDDEYVMCEILRDELIENGYDVIVATSGEEALEYLEKTTPDLIIIDLLLPDINGLEIIKKLEDEKKGSKIIVYTAYSEFSESPEIRYSSNVCQFLCKPVLSLDILKKAVETALA